jgi:glycerol-3-phosphate O-acyltransferase
VLVRADAPSKTVLFAVCGTDTTVQPVAADAAEAIKTAAPVSAATLANLILCTCPPQDLGQADILRIRQRT